jgi:hypothetical protein
MQGPFYNENREITVYCIFGGNLGYIKRIDIVREI